MGFSDRQVNALRRKLHDSFIHSRQAQGRTLSYIEGWHAIAEANRIFGFDGWDRETVESKCVLGRENRGAFHAVYLAKVRITVRAEDRIVIREGYGTGEAHGNSAGETHERALKTAETDATKRALATFGKPFGLGLYISTSQPREATFNPVNTPPIAEEDRRRTRQAIGRNGRYHVPKPRQIALDPELAALQSPPTAPHEDSPPGPSRGVAAVGSDEDPGDERSPTLADASARAYAVSPPDASPEIAPPALPQADGPRSSDAGHATLLEAEAPPLHEAPQGLLIDWPKRRREPAHLQYVRNQPCLICGRTPSDAHHLRFAQARALGRKVSDEFTVPLCRVHHRQLHHSGNELAWWEALVQDVDPLNVAKDLWEESRRLSPEITRTIKPWP